MSKLVSIALVVSATLAGCKGKETDKPAAPPATDPSAKPTDPATAVGVQTPAAPAAAPASLIAAGELKLGCVAWSEKLRTAACLTGVMGMGAESKLSLASVGNAPVADKVAFDAFDPKLEPATVADLNTKLAAAGFTALHATVMSLDPGKPVAIDGGTPLKTLTLTTKEGDPGSKGMATLLTAKLSAKCGATETVLFEAKDSEGLTVSPTVRTVGDYAIVEIHTAVAREGEGSSALDVTVLEISTCKVTTTTITK